MDIQLEPLPQEQQLSEVEVATPVDEVQATLPRPKSTLMMDEVRANEGLTPISGFRLNTAHMSWRADDALGRSMYVKCALSQEYNERTANQFVITRGLINDGFRMEDPNLFRFPIPMRYGKVRNLAYIAEEFILEPQLLIHPWAKAASKDPLVAEPNLQVATESTDLLEANITRVAKTLAYLTRLNPTQIQVPKEKQTKLLELYQGWVADCAEIYPNIIGDMFKAEEVLTKIITPNMHHLVTGFHHGDCEPYHFMVGKNGYFLTDWEFAKHNGYFSYDAAYLIHRLWTKVRSPELAMQLMAEYLGYVDFNEQEYETFKLMLATRVIGGWVDVKNDNSMTDGMEQISYQNWVLKELS
jgi:hypothetical protein